MAIIECAAPVVDGQIEPACGAVATTTRDIPTGHGSERVTLPLCAEHATEYDAELLEPGSVIIVLGAGASNIEAIREATSWPANWWLANERGVGGQHDRTPVEDTWCVVLPDDGSVSREELDADPAVATYETIPRDSHALAIWRAS